MQDALLILIQCVRADCVLILHQRRFDYSGLYCDIQNFGMALMTDRKDCGLLSASTSLGSDSGEKFLLMYCVCV